MSGCEKGCGVGQGGGSGGSIREAGGALGKLGAVREDAYFRKQDEELIKKLAENTASQDNNKMSGGQSKS